MIHVIVSVGSADRKAPIINDSLIPDEGTANIRAQQELAGYTYIRMARSLSLPHDPGESHGVMTGYFSFHPLGIFGKHAIVSRVISLTPALAQDTVELEQYREMIL